MQIIQYGDIQQRDKNRRKKLLWIPTNQKLKGKSIKNCKEGIIKAMSSQDLREDRKWWEVYHLKEFVTIYINETEIQLTFYKLIIYSVVENQTIYIKEIASQRHLTPGFELCQFSSGKLVEG